jgi:N-acetyl-gamma-glutamyl-phosphate/LysW-gamma-L-alpha-aminoadipyl-6-phosphate reductase
MLSVTIIGGSGYVGGELTRLVYLHPEVKLKATYSKSQAGKYIHTVHPNLRGILDMTFTDYSPIELATSSDITFFCLPHGQSSKIIPEIAKSNIRIIDLGADFRLKERSAYSKWYGFQHPAPDLLNEFVYGLPELHRKEIATTRKVAVPGCMATSAILSLAPIVREGLDDGRIIVDAKVGSSGSGGKPSLATHFSERYNVVRIYKPTGHRHTAEIIQELSLLQKRNIEVSMSAHSVNMVRGIETTSHVLTSNIPSVKDLWKIYRAFYSGSPFVRIVRDLHGVNKFPDPKFTIGSNFVDVGFDVDQETKRVVAIGALDNLVKGAAGNAVQCMNIMLGMDESEGLKSPPLHPV